MTKICIWLTKAVWWSCHIKPTSCKKKADARIQKVIKTENEIKVIGQTEKT